MPDVNELIRILDVASIGEGRYLGAAHDGGGRPVIEGSQLLAQTLVAASRQAPGRRVVSASMIFARPVDPSVDLEIDLGEVANGRTFSVYSPKIRQNGKVCTTGTVMLDVMAPDVVRHETPAPAVAGPEAGTPLELDVEGREVRIVDDTYSLDPDAPVGPPVIDAWLRFSHAPDDQAIHVGLITHIMGYIPLAAALRPHAGFGLAQAHHSITTGVNAISMAIHREIHADQWMLYHHHSTFAGDGMTHADCRVHDQAGHLLASFAVEAMVRPFGGGGGGKTAF